MTQVKDELIKVIQDEIPKINAEGGAKLYPEIISEEEANKMIDVKL